MKQYKGTPYFISTSGEVYRKGRASPLKPDITSKGYRRVTLSIEGKTQRLLVHRIVAETYLPKIEGKDYVNHIDNDPSNNDVSNLEWCTHSENMQHSHIQGRCSNLIASSKASELNQEKTKKKFQLLLGNLFIDTEIVNKRTFILYKCSNCQRQLRSRTDSIQFLKPNIVCKYC